MTTTDLLNALLAKKGQDYYNEFAAFMAALISDNTSGVAQALAYAQQSQNSSTAAAASAATAASLVLVKQPSEIAGIDPVLDFVFSAPTAVPSGVITGSSGKWVTGQNGLLTYVPAGTAPIEYDPITAVARGLLPEAPATNLLTYSRDLTNWTDPLGNTTVSADSATAPDGTQTADVLSSSVSGADRLRRKTLTVSADTTQRTFWALLKANGGGKANLCLSYGGGTAKATFRTFDAITGTSVLSSGVDEGYGMLQLANGYWLCWVVLANNGTNTTLQADLRPYGHPDLSAAGSIIFGGAQCEVGSFPTSYIATVGSTVTRTADVNTILLSSVPGWIGSEGTIYVEAMAPSLAANYPMCASLNDGTANNSISIYKSAAGSGAIVCDAMSGGVSQSYLGVGTVSAGTTFKAAFAFKAGAFAASLNGAAAVTGATGSIPAVTRLEIGSRAGSLFANGPIRRIVLFPRALSTSTLPLLTA